MILLRTNNRPCYIFIQNHEMTPILLKIKGKILTLGLQSPASWGFSFLLWFHTRHSLLLQLLASWLLLQQFLHTQEYRAASHLHLLPQILGYFHSDGCPVTVSSLKIASSPLSALHPLPVLFFLTALFSF